MNNQEMKHQAQKLARRAGRIFDEGRIGFNEFRYQGFDDSLDGFSWHRMATFRSIAEGMRVRLTQLASGAETSDLVGLEINVTSNKANDRYNLVNLEVYDSQLKSAHTKIRPICSDDMLALSGLLTQIEEGSLEKIQSSPLAATSAQVFKR